MTRYLTVMSTGPLAIIQDLGRTGLGAVGVGRSGAADATSYSLGARLVGYDLQPGEPGPASIEILFGGFSCTFSDDTTIALTGAEAPAMLDDWRVPYSSQVFVKAGQTLKLGVPANGLRTYLAIRGGITVPPVLGSRATDMMAKLGPPVVAKGDRLPIGEPGGLWFSSVSVAPVPALPTGDLLLDVYPGPRMGWLADPAQLTETVWEVSAASDRVGIRLMGGKLERHPDTLGLELPSEGAVRGLIQVPTGGEPVLFMADHPVTGGYPGVGVLTPHSTDIAAQARPGTKIRFRWLT